ncbi:MAG: GNAT family N-acetyltransferase [Anaerolineae bacterium]|nr:GNAT family N-acetyltransferase [Anaerolineae bacterium]
MTTADPPIDLKTLQIEPLGDSRCLMNFDCGEQEVNRGITRCCEWHGKYRNRVFCAFLPGMEFAVGFYCLGVSAHESKYLDDSIVSANGARAFVPFIYLHYLGVQSEYQKKGIGTLLLLNALERSSLTIKNIGIYGVALHALTSRSADLYDRYGFREHKGSPKYPFMILPAQSVIDLFP